MAKMFEVCESTAWLAGRPATLCPGGSWLERPPGGIGLFRQGEKRLHDPGVLVACGIEKEPVVNEALHGSNRAALLGRSRPDDGDRAQLFAKEQCRLGHDQVGLEQVSDVRAAGAGVGINRAVELGESKIAVGDVGGAAGFVVPGLEA